MLRFHFLSCLVLLPAATDGAKSSLNIGLDVDLPDFGGRGDRSELSADRACLQYIGEGYEICEKQTSGDCNKYAFAEGGRLYACRNDNTPAILGGNVCRKKLAWDGHFKHCPDNSVAEGQKRAKEQADIEAAAAHAAAAKERARRDRERRQREKREREEMEDYEYARQKLEEEEHMFACMCTGVAIVASILLFVLRHTIVATAKALMRAAVYSGVTWAAASAVALPTLKYRYDALWGLLDLVSYFTGFGDEPLNAAALIGSTYLTLKLLIWCNSGKPRAKQPATAASSASGGGSGSGAAARTAFGPGTSVVVRGLEAKPELNGQRARVIGFDAVTQRYNVSVNGGSAVALKSSNLVAAAA